MVKNSPENAVARAQFDEDRPCVDGRRFPGTLPRSLAAVAAGLGVPSRADAAEMERPVGLDGRNPGNSKGNASNMGKQDFGDAIGRELQNLYDDVVAQPIPDRFLNLLNQLEKNMVSSGLSVGAPREQE